MRELPKSWGFDPRAHDIAFNFYVTAVIFQVLPIIDFIFYRLAYKFSKNGTWFMRVIKMYLPIRILCMAYILYVYNSWLGIGMYTSTTDVQFLERINRIPQCK